MKMGTSIKPNSALAKFFLPPSPKQYVKRQKLDHETHREHALRSQLDADKRRHQRYLELVATRVRKLRETVPQVDRYLKLLDRLAPDTIAYSRRNCDQDLADVAVRLGLAAIPDTYSRFLLVEITLAWLTDLAKAQKTYSFDDADIFGTAEPETIDELKAALNLV